MLLVEKIAGSTLKDVITEFVGSSSSDSDEGTDEPAVNNDGVSEQSEPETTSDASALGMFKLLGLLLIGVNVVVS